ncbi:hypothetical protein ES703_60392 [subsurface metagenome]
MPTEHFAYIGIDLSDPFAKRKRPCTRATIGTNLNCTFDEWEYNLTGNQIVLDRIPSTQFVLAVDGPQGLAGNPECAMRFGERKIGTAGKSPYSFPPIGKPYARFVQGSVKLFYSLSKSHRFRLYRLKKHKLDTNLIEVYPGASWPVIAGHGLPNKRLWAGRRYRYEALLKNGIKFSPEYTAEVPPTHDQLDAAIAAYTAYFFTIGKTIAYGQDPFEDKRLHILREGLIVQPLHI